VDTTIGWGRNTKKGRLGFVIEITKKNWSGRGDSNARPQPWQGRYQSF
jgi:hypothetical protein